MIRGFRGTSLVDYPGRICSVVFTGGCNFRCPYCYNVDLVEPSRLKRLPEIPEQEVLRELSRRKGFISGVTVTGGEPTVWGRRLRSFLERLKYELSLMIKLDTNGSNPELVASLLNEGLVDFLAVDFKTSPSRYPELKADFAPVKRTLEEVLPKAPKHEVRITLVPGLISKRELEEMLPLLNGRVVALQKFVHSVEHLDPDFPKVPFPEDELKRILEFLREKGLELVLRL